MPSDLCKRAQVTYGRVPILVRFDSGEGRLGRMHASAPGSRTMNS